MKKIPLSNEQQKWLIGLFDEVRKANDAGEKCALGAQVFEDGLAVQLFHGERARIAAAVLGGNLDKNVASAAQRVHEYASTDPAAHASKKDKAAAFEWLRRHVQCKPTRSTKIHKLRIMPPSPCMRCGRRKICAKRSPRAGSDD
ncbi:hypothetical protein [Thiohalophilus sp.]|uniref:hypothetical protein n=1 Tax=Thiohalophilus sp. TaxID=3028392 RepID=UPI002ACE1131|nr:hypothetical protein [Thiohalophilus sp.]MDZ7804322.1 hypothetical protein [Thiohalophilus sp.]